MSDEEILRLFKSMKTIAVVGLSSNPMRPSFGVSRFLQQQGYRVVPVNPQETEVLGERAYPSIRDVQEPVDVVNVFRRPARVPEIVNDLIGRNVRCLWMQEGVVNEQAAAMAEAAGIPVVMDRCILKEMARLLR
jgi:predicted CoA-binding protein